MRSRPRLGVHVWLRARPPARPHQPARLTRREEETKNERAASGGEGGVKKKKNSMHLSSTHLLLSPSHPSLSPPTTSTTHKRNHQHPKEPKTNSAPRKPWMLRAPDVAAWAHGANALTRCQTSSVQAGVGPVSTQAISGPKRRKIGPKTPQTGANGRRGHQSPPELWARKQAHQSFLSSSC